MSDLLKRRFVDQIRCCSARARASRPRRRHQPGCPERSHFYRKGSRPDRREAAYCPGARRAQNTWRNRRWATLIVASLLFLFSFFLDIQDSRRPPPARFVGFHLIIALRTGDAGAQAHHQQPADRHRHRAGVVALLGGRTSAPGSALITCSPPGAEIHLWRRNGCSRPDHRPPPAVFWIIFALLALATTTPSSNHRRLASLSRAFLILRAGAGAALGAGAAHLRVFSRAPGAAACPIGLLRRSRKHLAEGTPHQVQSSPNASTKATAARVCLVPTSGYGHQGPRRRDRSPDRPRLHPLRACVDTCRPGR